MLLLKAILIILNTMLLGGALIALILYVRKTSVIAELSEETTKEVKSTTIISREAVELSRSVLLEMKATRESLTEPLVISYFERRTVENNSYIFFVIENIGNGVARNIQYEFEPTLVGNDMKSIDRISNLGTKIDTLPPSYRLVNLLGRAGHYIDLESINEDEINEHLPRKFALTLRYQDAITSKQFQSTFSLDLRVPLGSCNQ